MRRMHGDECADRSLPTGAPPAVQQPDFIELPICNTWLDHGKRTCA
ncbi:MAG: hypothetical protein GY716_12095 [bacterium]|nr:hypothetical protein [bacterium]